MSAQESNSPLQGGAGVHVEHDLVVLTVRPPGAEMEVNLHPDDAVALSLLLRDAAKEAR